MAWKFQRIPRLVPFEGDTTIFLSFPVDGTFVVGFYCVDDVEGV